MCLLTGDAASARPPEAGHNRGPDTEPGRRWRIHCWTKAKAARPSAKLPVEIVRRRVARARDLGLTYADYAAIREVSGRDICGFLLSSNALGPAGRGPDAARLSRLSGIRGADRLALVHPPLDLATFAALDQIDEEHRAPPLLGRIGEIRAALARAQGRRPAAGLVLVAAAPLERDWGTAGRLGAVIDADRMFV